MNSEEQRVSFTHARLRRGDSRIARIFREELNFKGGLRPHLIYIIYIISMRKETVKNKIEAK